MAFQDVAERPVSSRDAMIVTAMKLFRERGYEGVGMADLVRESGAPRGSIYFHFPGGKEEIAIEAIRYAEAMVAERMRARRKAASMEAAIDEICQAWARATAESDFARGCGVGLIGLEMSATSPALREAAAQAFQTWRRLFAEIAESFGYAPAAAERIAGATMSSIQGAIVMGRTMRSVEPFADIAESLKALAARLRSDQATTL